MHKESKFRYLFCVCFVVAVFIVFLIQLVNWQIINGSQYREKADSSSLYNIKKEAVRGEILDVNGVSLAINSMGYRVVFNKVYSDDETENETILKLISLFEQKNEEWIDELPIILDENDNYVFNEAKQDEIDKLKKDYRLNNYATAEDCINMLSSEKWFDCEIENKKDKRNVLSVKYNMNKTGYTNNKNYIFAEDISYDMVAIISENNTKLPGVQVKTTSVRKYENGEVAPHIVGSIGAISQEEYEELKDKGYELNSKIGKMGIEQAFEEYLVGTDGIEQIEVLNNENVTVFSEKEVTPTVAGNTIYLTIDSELQKVAHESLMENVEEAQKYVSDKVTGAAVMLDVSDFSVLCAQSYPTYDLNRYYTEPDYYEQIVLDEKNPLYSRAFEGAYTVGSTMKPAVALAALEEKVLDNTTSYVCTHTYQRFAPSYMPVCMGHHGGVALTKALAVSCNIYFFEAGYYLGIDSLNAYQKRFGLGQKTGVEIYERSGILAGPKEREAAGGIWYDGDTIAAAIGQSDNLITPVQLATYVATIANQGTRYRTHLVEKITDYSRQNVILENTKDNIEVMDTVKASDENWAYLKEAMRAVITDSSGTAHRIFGNYGIAIAGKTGTAENLDNSADHELFIAFAPFDNPEVALAVVIEHGKTGVYPQYVAKALLDAYFKTENGYEIEKPEEPEEPESSQTEQTENNTENNQ
ncbi:MAG: penicillin-binding transpeptidase domain-containing protein [Clostridia bacterium]|nr:penicillin-binding transpeptidase domain-containing protein [Clostridia bacterium]